MSFLDSLKNTLDKAAHKSKDALNSVGETSEKLTSEAKSKLEETTHNLGDKAHEWSQHAKEKAEDFKDAAHRDKGE